MIDEIRQALNQLIAQVSELPSTEQNEHLVNMAADYLGVADGYLETYKHRCAMCGEDNEFKCRCPKRQ